MRKVLVVAVREYQAAVRTKAFVITLVAMPIIWGGSILVQVALREKVDTNDKAVAVLDRTPGGRLLTAITKAASERNEHEIHDEQGRQIKPRFLVEEAQIVYESMEEASLELSKRVREGKILAYVLIESDVISATQDEQHPSIAYHSNSPTYDDFRAWLSTALNARVRELRFQSAKLDPKLVEQLTRWVNLRSLGLVETDETGQITEAKETNKFANFLIPLAMLMLLVMTVLIGASPLMQSVLEEKMQRIAEVLLGSISPFQLMMGKLLGMVGVSLTIGTFYLFGAFVSIHYSGFGEMFPVPLVIWFVIYQALAVLMYGSMFIAIGAAVTDLKEAQSLMMPVTLLVVSPMFVWMNVVKEPLSPFATVISLIPPATPMLMILRQSVPPGIPIWQPLLGVALVLASTALCVFVAGRIFRVGILMQGKGANLSEMLRWVLRG